MKKLTLTTIFNLIAIALLAQVPQGISHQAVIRNAANELVTNSPIGIRVSIIQGTPGGIAVYSETHNPISNANGLITFIIGQGTVVSGVFNQIDWANQPYFIKTEADPIGGTNYTITGTSQLFSVPYALHSNKASTLKNGQEAGEILFWDGSEWVAIPPGQHDEALRFCDGIPTWGECPYNLFLLAEPEPGGEVHGAGKFKAGEAVAISATTNLGWQLVNWTDAGGIVSVVSGFNYIMPANDVTLTANFEMTDYTLTLDASPAQGGSVTGGGIYNLGDQVQLNATSNLGWQFVSWTDTDGIVSETPTFTYTMPAVDITLTANFEMIDYTLTLVANPTEGGTLTGGGEYNFGDQVQLNATANLGWQFVNWTDGDGVVSVNPGFSYTMPATDITLTANFEMIDYTLTLVANPSGGGSVTGSGIYNFGDVIQVNAVANSGWEFVSWTGDTNYVENPASPTTSVTMPAAHISLTANFQEDPILPFTCGNDITFVYRGTEVTYGTIERGGLCWLDRNLGASRVPTSVTDAQGFGDLFQWGRLSDGHQDRLSETTTTLSNNDIPGHGQFIIIDTIPYDWRSPQNDNLWQGNNGINNPCPSGWRVPTGLELDTERLSWATSNASGAYGSTLKWPVAGNRFNDGIVYAAGSVGLIWSSSYTGTQASSLIIESDYAGVQPSMRRARGMSVRCVREDFLMPELFNLNLNANPVEGGTVEGQGQYEAGEQVSITATTNPGWVFVNWTDEDSEQVSAVANFIYTIPAQDITLTANFVEEQAGFACGHPLVDTRDGQSYATVQIGEQCWMSENLNIGTRIDGSSNQTNNGIIEKYCYGNSEAQCDVFGGLYQWNEMMAYSTTPGKQGICPEGWHIPTDAEWCTLEQEVDPTITCSSTGWRGVDGGGKLKQAGTTHWLSPNTGATNESGFTALPAPHLITNGSWGYSGHYTFLWSSSQYDASTSWTRILRYDNAQVGRSNYSPAYGFSVRCLKNVTHNLILEAEPSGAGTVSGAGQYEAGEEINVSATANPGWEFANWTGDTDYVDDPASSTTSVTMPAEHISLTANFQEDQILPFICGNNFTFIYRGSEVTYGTIERGGLCWLDRNLGASRVPISSTDSQGYGDLLQWGRLDDGHQHRQSGSTTTLSNNDVPGHGHFIISNTTPWDWRSPQNDNLWQGNNGVNNPCPSGWRVPTDLELDAERLSWGSNNPAGAFASTLKWPLGGDRRHNGGLYGVGTRGVVWSSSVNDVTSRVLFISISTTDMGNYYRSYGMSVRCVRDETSLPSTYDLNLEVNPPDAGTVTGDGEYEAGQEINLNATANAGWEFANWTDADGIVSETPNFTFTMPAVDITLTANFEIIDYSLTLLANPTEGGTVTGGGEYNFGDQMQLNATTNLGWQFVNWTDADGIVSEAPNFTFTMPANNVTLTANFNEEEPVIFNCGDTITFTYRGQQVTYGTISRGGLCWLDRNLGADPMPFVPAEDATGKTDTRLYGDFFQWGRLNDGHQDRTSSTTPGPVNQDVPGHGNFITVSSSPYDWRSPQNNALWQGEDGINNPCPEGWRVPTEAELNAERQSWGSNNSAGAYASTLKWPVGGSRSYNGTLSFVGIGGNVWSSSVSGADARRLTFNSGDAFMTSFPRALGMSVRCVRDEPTLP